jgi:hypothetical protein
MYRAGSGVGSKKLSLLDIFDILNPYENGPRKSGHCPKWTQTRLLIAMGLLHVLASV